jgi:pyruvate dehydrogenase E2 component (dihydrolipoamide acetyltransferase)
MDVTMRLPDLATNDSSVKVLRWLVEIGQPVRRGQPLVEVETDKSVMEVESFVTGTLRSISVPPGDQAMTGQVIAVFDATELIEAVSSAPIVERKVPAGKAGLVPATRATNTERFSFFERNRRARGARCPDLPIELNVAQRTLARRMRESKQNIPHYYLQTSANAEPMVARRAAAVRAKPVWDAFFVSTAGRALKRYPQMCYRFADDRLVPSEVDAINVAVDWQGDLFTIVVTHPAEKPPEQISDEIRAALEELRGGDPLARALRPANLTISNLGGTNVESFAAVINPPEAAILAVGKIRPVVVAVDGQAVIQTRVSLTLSVDHRVVNGKYAGNFLSALVEELESL